jgi:hypothetical protein
LGEKKEKISIMQCVRNNKALSKEELYKESGPLSALPLMAPCSGQPHGLEL